MSFISFTSPPTGSVGIVPAPFYLDTTDDIDTITTAGYLNNQLGCSSTLALNQLYDGALIFGTNTTSIVSSFIASISSLNGIVTLSEQSSGGASVILPVVSGDFAVFSGTDGTIADLGYIPSNAAKTTVVMANSTVTSGNVPSFSDTAGTVTDSGIVATSLVTNTALTTMAAGAGFVMNKVNGTESSNAVTASGLSGTITTSSLSVSAGGQYIINWTNTFITASSTVLITYAGGTNTIINITLRAVPSGGGGSASLIVNNENSIAPLNGTVKIAYLIM